MRKPSTSVLARQEVKSAERSAAIGERYVQLAYLAPNASPEDLKYLARMCGTLPTFPTILRVLAAR